MQTAMFSSSSGTQQSFSDASVQGTPAKGYIQPEVKTESVLSKHVMFSPNTSNKQMLGNQSFDTTITTTSLSTVTSTLDTSNATLTNSVSNSMQFSSKSAPFVNQNLSTKTENASENGTLQVRSNNVC